MSMNQQDIVRDPWRGVYNAIRDSILSGEYPPSARLVEQQLADRFGISRGPVRTALQELERTGLVVSIDRRGTFVRTLSDSDMEEIFSLCGVLSEFAIRRAIGRIGEPERRWLEEFKARIGTIDDPEEFLGQQIEFGRWLFRVANHSRALDIFESLLIQARAVELFRAALDDIGDWRAADFLDLGASCDAFIAGDAQTAIEIANRLIAGILELSLSHSTAIGDASIATPAS